MSEDNPWRLGEAHKRYENPWFKVEDVDAVDPAGVARQYGLIRFKKRAVGIIPIGPDGRVHLVGQWRVPLARYSWEIIEGGVEAGEELEASARRELEEEAGLKAGRLVQILHMHLSNSVTDEEAFVYLGLDLVAGEASPEPVEVLQNRTQAFADLVADVVTGKITDAITVAGVLRAHHMAVTGEIEPTLARAMLGT